MQLFFALALSFLDADFFSYLFEPRDAFPFFALAFFSEVFCVWTASRDERLM